MALGATIRELRKGAGATQQETAARVGVSVDTYRRWEWGRFQPRADQLMKLAGTLGTTVEELLHPEEVVKHGEGGKGAAADEGTGA